VGLVVFGTDEGQGIDLIGLWTENRPNGRR
jgi:hypothetical protein